MALLLTGKLPEHRVNLFFKLFHRHVRPVTTPVRHLRADKKEKRKKAKERTINQCTHARSARPLFHHLLTHTEGVCFLKTSGLTDVIRYTHQIERKMRLTRRVSATPSPINTLPVCWLVRFIKYRNRTPPPRPSHTIRICFLAQRCFLKRTMRRRAFTINRSAPFTHSQPEGTPSWRCRTQRTTCRCDDFNKTAIFVVEQREAKPQDCLFANPALAPKPDPLTSAQFNTLCQKQRHRMTFKQSH